MSIQTTIDMPALCPRCYKQSDGHYSVKMSRPRTRPQEDELCFQCPVCGLEITAITRYVCVCDPDEV
jgi:hypothetical protein